MGEIFGRRELKTIRPGPQTPALVSSGTRNSRGIALNFDKGRTKDFFPQKKNHEGGVGGQRTVSNSPAAPMFTLHLPMGPTSDPARPVA